MKESNAHEQSREELRQLSLAQIRQLRKRTLAPGAVWQEPPPLAPQERSGVVPLSFAQERLWFLDQLGFSGAAYNSQVIVRLEGELNVTALERSLTDLVARHASLRTRFVSDQGRPVQIVDATGAVRLELRDLSHLVDNDRSTRVREQCAIEMGHAFDLARGALFRAMLLRLSQRQHVLLLTIHHIATDGWSWGILNRELSMLYGAYVRGEAPVLPPLPVQYADYAIWQRNWLQGEALEKRLAYWREQLHGAPWELQLPTDRAPRAIASFRGARCGFHVSRTLQKSLLELSQQQGVTLFMTLLAAFQALLSRYSGQQDIVVGCPIAGRTHAQSEGLVGFFVNTLALRVDTSGNPTFRQLLRRVREVTLQAYAHQDLPFDKLVMELHPQRSLSRQPLFQAALSLQNYPQPSLQLPGLTWTRLESDHVMAVFDLTLHLLEADDGLHGTFVYATDLFDAGTIDRMAGHLRVLLEAAAASVDCAIDDLPILPAAERDRVLLEFNDTTVSYPAHEPIDRLFEATAAGTPRALAVIEEDRSLSYGELDALAERVARHLSEHDVTAGDYVAILMQRCTEMLIVQLAVLKCGAVYVPIDPAAPEERQRFVVRDCSARCVVALGPPAAAWDTVVWIDVDRCMRAQASGPERKRLPAVDSRHPAYVMYTSGSTGTPKGVVVPHRAVNRLVINSNYVHIVPGDRIAHCSNPAFDASTLEIWGGLLNGATVVIVPQSIVLEAARFAETLSRHQVTILWLTIGLFAQYAQALAHVLPRLRYVFTGGDVVDPVLIRRVLCSGPPQHLMNAYGPTECTTFSTTHLIATLADDATSIPIGRPISNTRIYVLDARLRPVPIGVAGEIYIGGPGVALGYLNRPELTAERFVRDTFGAEEDGRLYKTGDVGRWRADGTIEFLGRNDQQVKLRGFRVELGEIETHLLRHGGVNEAVVIVREDTAGDKRLVAYVTVRDGGSVSPQELRAFLEKVLPEYMMPKAFVILPSLPLTTNGKLDRRALPAPAIDAYTREEYQEPQNETERILARIWCELLGIERVGRQDNFFGLGGHSLLVLQALFKINEVLNCVLTARDVYRSPTLADLAERIRGHCVNDELVDLQREAVLGHSIGTATNVRSVPARAVLLTGATGFVGRFLLAELLHETDATVYCLVRAGSQQQATQRLRATLAKWDLWYPDFELRVVAVAGDLRRPRLGIDELTYEILSQHVDSVYHCATSMNHLEPYAAAKSANVDSARELVKLATTHKTKLINYISTLSVFRPDGANSRRIVDETTPIEAEVHPSSAGYAASKWVAEKIFTMASARGAPCNIFRLGLVWADTWRGRYDELQREYRLLKSCLMSGYAIANYRYSAAPTPIDYVARSVVCLANMHPQGRGVFHISSGDQLIDGVFERCNEVAGTSLELVAHYDWICEMQRLHQQGRSLPIVPLIEHAFAMDRASFEEQQRRIQGVRVRLDCARTHRELARAGIVAPSVDDVLLRRCVESMCCRDEDLRKAVPDGAVFAVRQPSLSALRPS